MDNQNMANKIQQGVFSARMDGITPPADSKPKECFFCHTVVESGCIRCTKCGKGSFVRKCEKVEPVKPGKPATGEQRPSDAFAGPEKELLKICQHRLTSMGIRYVLHLRPKMRTNDGLPDLLFCYRGLAFAVELKCAIGHLDDAQRDALERLEHDGWRVSVVWSLAGLDEFIKKHTEKT